MQIGNIIRCLEVAFLPHLKAIFFVSWPISDIVQVSAGSYLSKVGFVESSRSTNAWTCGHHIDQLQIGIGVPELNKFNPQLDSSEMKSTFGLRDLHWAIPL